MSNALARRYAFFQETTQGTGPVDWAASGTPFYFLRDSIDPAVFLQSMIDDERQRSTIKTGFKKIKGIKGGIPFTALSYLTGNEDTSRADADTATNSALMLLLQHGFGGMRKATSQTVTAGATPTAVPVDAVTGIAPGDWMGFLDGDALIHPRRVDSISTLTLNLNMELPFSPTATSIARGLPFFYIDEARLSDSALGPYTLSLLIEIGLLAARTLWEANGCVLAPTTITLERNAVARIDWAGMAGSFKTPESLSSPTWTTATAGQPGLAIGPNTSVLYADRGDDEAASIHVSGFVVNTGIARQPVNTQTTAQAGMPGVYGYTMGEAESTIQMTVIPHSDDHLDDFNADTEKHVLFERLETDGKGWAIYAPRCQIAPNPVFASADNRVGQNITLQCLTNTDAPVGAVDGWSSCIQLVLC